MELKEFTILKDRLNKDIAKSILKSIKEFEEKTGYPVSAIDVRIGLIEWDKMMVTGGIIDREVTVSVDATVKL